MPRQVTVLKEKVENILNLMGFRSFSVSVEPSLRKISVIIEEEPALKDHLADLVLNLNSILKVIGKKLSEDPIIFDINNYRRERENIIIDLAKAAARRAVATKEQVSLPAMNAYERRLVHAELGVRPDVSTESVGEGKDRYVVVKAVE